MCINIVSDKNNFGNFLAVLKLFAQTNYNIQKNLTLSVAKNATYLSPKFKIKLLTLLVMIFCKLT